MSKKYPDNPIVGILAKAIKQEWVETGSTSGQNDTRDDLEDLRYILLSQEERILNLERKLEFLMELAFQTETKDNPPKEDRKGKKIALPYPTTYVSYKPPIQKEDTSDIEDKQSKETDTHDDNQYE